MKKFFAISSLILMVSMVSCGCGSASSCWTRSGSRVPTSSTYAGAAPVSAPIMESSMVYSSGCNPCAAVTNACNPCSTSCNACDPCGGSGTSNYPAAMPGPNG